MTQASQASSPGLSMTGSADRAPRARSSARQPSANRSSARAASRSTAPGAARRNQPFPRPPPLDTGVHHAVGDEHSREAPLESDTLSPVVLDVALVRLFPLTLAAAIFKPRPTFLRLIRTAPRSPSDRQRRPGTYRPGTTQSNGAHRRQRGSFVSALVKNSPGAIVRLHRKHVSFWIASYTCCLPIDDLTHPTGLATPRGTHALCLLGLTDTGTLRALRSAVTGPRRSHLSR
jgi:hypothetical protein